MPAWQSVDDQSYAEITAEARGRLPWLCPVWTDHNAHDPGITFLELLAWYKEMQQYQMNRLPPALQWKLLALAGLEPLPAAPAVCALELPPDAPARPPCARLSCAQSVPFELTEPVPARRAVLERVLIQTEGGTADAGGFLSGGTAFAPFRFGGVPGSALCLGFSRLPEDTLRLWFETDGESPVPAPGDGTPPPRELVWEAGGRVIMPVKDETFALSASGFVTLPVPSDWPREADGLYWLRVRETDAGCEGPARLTGLSAARYQAVQQESRALSYTFRIPAEPGFRVRVDSEPVRDGAWAVYLRRPGGWERTDRVRVTRTETGAALSADGTGTAQDGSDNLLLISMDPAHRHSLTWEARGRPCEELRLDLGGQVPLALSLMCPTLCRDGAVRPALWRRVEDLSVCGPRDRVFVCDADRETVRFGDGNHGAAVMGGPVLAAELVLSFCARGNLPADTRLYFVSDGAPAHNGAAAGGRDRERVEEGRVRLLRMLDRTVKCASAADFERCAKETPGVRVAGAKAVPGYDRRSPRQKKAAHVTVVVLAPGGEADGRFLGAVSRQLDRFRPVCVRTEAVSVRYVSFGLRVRVQAEPEAKEAEVRRELEALFIPCEGRIGAAARIDDVTAALQRAPGVRRVEQVDLRRLDQNSYETAAGNLQVLPDALLRLDRLELELIYP